MDKILTFISVINQSGIWAIHKESVLMSNLFKLSRNIEIRQGADLDAFCSRKQFW